MAVSRNTTETPKNLYARAETLWDTARFAFRPVRGATAELDPASYSIVGAPKAAYRLRLCMGVLPVFDATSRYSERWWCRAESELARVTSVTTKPVAQEQKRLQLLSLETL